MFHVKWHEINENEKRAMIEGYQTQTFSLAVFLELKARMKESNRKNLPADC